MYQLCNSEQRDFELWPQASQRLGLQVCTSMLSWTTFAALESSRVLFWAFKDSLSLHPLHLSTYRVIGREITGNTQEQYWGKPCPIDEQ